MKLVVIESPYGRNPDGSVADAATIERNVRYLRACMADCLARGEAPIASHGLYTQPGVLDDSKPEERKKGMLAGWAWYRVVDAIVVYVDLGWTSGMLAGVENWKKTTGRSVEAVLIEQRTLGGEWPVSLSPTYEQVVEQRNAAYKALEACIHPNTGLHQLGMDLMHEADDSEDEARLFALADDLTNLAQKALGK